MPWAAGSYTKGNSGTGGWTGDASLGIGIEASRHDTQDNDFATGINQCLNKDGSNAATGNLNLGGFIPTNLAAGTAAAPALCVGSDVNTGVFGPAADTWAVATNGSERVRIDSSGRVGIGETSPVEALVIKTGASATAGVSFRGNNAAAANEVWVGQGSDGLSGFIYARGNSVLIFGTNNTERMRIASSGEIGIGRVPITSYRLSTQGAGTTTSTSSLLCLDSTGATTFLVYDSGRITTGSRTESPYNFTTGLGANVYVNSSGELFRSTSSLKYKTDVVDYDKGLAEVLQIQPKYYKATNSGEQVFAGLIAEQIDEVGLSEFVQYAPDESPDAINYGHMAALFTKAIQELNAKVEALQARVDELEAA
jgi:hypothetical protein